VKPGKVATPDKGSEAAAQEKVATKIKVAAFQVKVAGSKLDFWRSSAAGWLALARTWVRSPG
jgi:hypothetical protein